MAKGANQKLKLLYLMDILLENTDENHGITMDEIIAKLQMNDISAERKSLYDDFEMLRLYGLDVERYKKGRSHYYHVLSRDFEIAELKLLVDAVQSSKFITKKKSDELIRKIEKLTSKYEASTLERQVYVQKRIKTMNETIYYTVDELHQAMNQNVKVRFQYFQWNRNKEMELRRDGAYYHISPWGLSWDNENYYLIGYDEEAEIMKHFRVDKMLKVKATEEPRKGKEEFEKIQMAEYTQKHFDMFDGKEEVVEISFDNSLVGVVIDRFGKDVILLKEDDMHVIARVKVAVSNPFLAWIMSFGDKARICSPEWVVAEIRELLQSISKLYAET
ncbi:MAG: WYL domain-containing protein [Eubacterium sp.]|nr:WYL domain-containing protein [Eubacterium sp.]